MDGIPSSPSRSLFLPLLGLFDQLHQREHLWFGGRFKGFLPLLRRKNLSKEILYKEMIIPAVKGLKTGEPSVFLATIRKEDLMAQSGAPNLIIITRGDPCPSHFVDLSGWIPEALKASGSGSCVDRRYIWEEV